jgi:hypothetical protein
VADAMQAVLTTVADEAARPTGFTERTSKLTGAKFVQGLVFGWMADPQATLEALAQTVATVGVTITAQGLDERFSQESAALLQQVLQAAVAAVIAAEPVAVPLLQRFTQVWVLDSSTISLPAELAADWLGCGGRPGEGEAALKLQVGLDLCTGALQGPDLYAGRTSDRSTAQQAAARPAGSLRMADLGYFNVAVLADLEQEGSFWLTRIQAGTVIAEPSGRRLDLPEWLAQHAGPVDLPILLGAPAKIPSRLLAVPVTEETANERRRKLRKEARHKGQAVSQTRLALAGWNIWATNVPVTQLTLAEALVLARVRWQIEMLFRLWKKYGQVDAWRSTKPWRIMTEVYAKLVAMVIQHWLFLVSCWAYPDRSLQKATQTVQKHALHLAWALTAGLGPLGEAIGVIQRCLAKGCRINKSRAEPHAYQLLLDPGGLA